MRIDWTPQRSRPREQLLVAPATNLGKPFEAQSLSDTDPGTDDDLVLEDRGPQIVNLMTQGDPRRLRQRAERSEPTPMCSGGVLYPLEIDDVIYMRALVQLRRGDPMRQLEAFGTNVR